MTRPLLNKKGFTIVEILIAVGIIAVLAGGTIVAYKGVRTRARASALTTEIKTMAEGFELYAQKMTLTTWPTDTSMTIPSGSDPLISVIRAQNPVFANYVPPIPKIDGLETIEWRYDHDGNDYACGGTWNKGVNIFIVKMNDMNLVKIIDDSIDGDNDLNCGKVRWKNSSGGTLVYGISSTSAIQ